MVFHWNACDNKSTQVSRTFLSILADLNNTLNNGLDSILDFLLFLSPFIII